MLGNFTYCNPTRLHFGEQALEQLAGELIEYGGRVLLVYGGGSIKKTGIYEKVTAILKDCGRKCSRWRGSCPTPRWKCSMRVAARPKKTTWT